MGARVSVIIPCFNCARYVGDAIRSALDQTFRDIEIVVVNDGSTDAFDIAVAPYSSKIKVINQSNLGLAMARNAALAASDSEFVAYLDADDRWLPEKVAMQVWELSANDHVSMVHTGIRFIDSAGRVAPREKILWSSPEQLSLVSLLRHNTITVSSVLHRRSAFDSEFFAGDIRGCEDWDLWLRFLERGLKVIFIQEVLTEYRVHGDNMSTSPDLMLNSTVAVMNRVLSRTDVPALRKVANEVRRESLRALGHCAFEEGNFALARTRYLRAASAIRIADVPRVLCTLWPQLGLMVRRLRRAVDFPLQ